MNNKLSINLATVKRISIITDIVVPVALYFALINQINIIAWALLGIVTMTRLALVIVTK